MHESVFEGGREGVREGRGGVKALGFRGIEAREERRTREKLQRVFVHVHGEACARAKRRRREKQQR